MCRSVMWVMWEGSEWGWRLKGGAAPGHACVACFRSEAYISRGPQVVAGMTVPP